MMRDWLRPLNPPLVEWAGRRVWVIGGSTGIGRACASALHAAGAQVYLSARSEAALNEFVSTHPGARALPLSVEKLDQMRIAARLTLEDGPIDMVLYCAGRYSPQRATSFDLNEMLAHQRVNYVGALHALDAVLPSMLAAGKGHLSLVGSVAGYAGLPNSLAYGPTKAALINLAQTLYLDLRPRGIGVSLVNPGFVETPLTEQNRFHMPALISAEEAARHMVRGWARGRFEIHYPLRFTLAMKVLSMLPFRLYQAAVRRGTGL